VAETRSRVSHDYTILRRIKSYESLLAIVAGENSLLRRSWFLIEDLIVALEVMSTNKGFPVIRVITICY
jgi:hypothetical protein